MLNLMGLLTELYFADVFPLIPTGIAILLTNNKWIFVVVVCCLWQSGTVSRADTNHATPLDGFRGLYGASSTWLPPPSCGAHPPQIILTPTTGIIYI